MINPRYAHLLMLLVLTACTSNPQEMITSVEKLPQVVHPEWVKNAVIYEVNIRQFTPEGTFQAFRKHLPRLKELGVDILWIMPVQPIGKKNRKGSLGSYYAVKDYYGINPEFGTEKDFTELVKAIHAQGMKVLIDWVPNHTAWDNELTVQHPEWYQHDYKGQFISPRGWDWSDVIALDYEQPGLRAYMTDALTYWVKQFDIDGYRCDVAGYVPTDFWVQVRQSLDAVKPVMMLAEWDDRAIHYAFDMTYAWELETAMRQVASGERDATAINAYMARQINSTALGELKMTHTSNHDKNAWEGTVFERFGKAAETFAALTFVVEGMPLIYSGQEVGLNRPLAFFEKDSISWGDHPFNALYSRLIKLKKDNPALWNGEWGSRMLPLPTSSPSQINAIYREKDDNRVLAVFNNSPEPATFSILSAQYAGNYKIFKSRSEVELTGSDTLSLGPWGYELYIH